MKRYKKNPNNAELSGGFVMLILGLLAMPAIGFVMCFSKDKGTRSLGLVLLIVGIVFYAIASVKY